MNEGFAASTNILHELSNLMLYSSNSLTLVCVYSVLNLEGFFISMSNLSRDKMSNEKETPEEIIINRGEIVYKELEEREGHESTARDIPIESYVYAYLKAIDSAYKYLIDTHLHDKTMGPRLDGLKDRFNLVIEDLWSYYNDKEK